MILAFVQVAILVWQIMEINGYNVLKLVKWDITLKKIRINLGYGARVGGPKNHKK